MKRMIAWVIYVVGGVLAVKVAAASLVSGGLVENFVGMAYGVMIWWVAVGFGVRLGVSPDDFIASIVSSLGFRHEVERDPDATEEAPASHPPL